MPRTITTIVNDVIRQAGKLKELKAEWEFPIELHDGWRRRVSVTIHIDNCMLQGEEHRGKVWVSVFACGWPERKNREQKGGLASRQFWGWAPPHRLTRKWVGEVLRREIETAYLAAEAFTEADTHEGGSFLTEDDDDAMENFQREREYFESTLKA